MNHDNEDRENLRSVYGVIGTLHSTIIATRFAVAGLYMAALAFLASALPVDPGKALLPGTAIGALGMALTLALWILEIRNLCLLENLEDRGRSIESELKVSEELGLFWLMLKQPEGPRVPFIRWRLPYTHNSKAKEVITYIFTHSFGLSMIYFLGIAFWGWVLFRVR